MPGDDKSPDPKKYLEVVLGTGRNVYYTDRFDTVRELTEYFEGAIQCHRSVVMFLFNVVVIRDDYGEIRKIVELVSVDPGTGELVTNSVYDTVDGKLQYSGNTFFLGI